MCSCGSTKRTEYTLGLCTTKLAMKGPEFDVSILFLKYSGHDPCLWLLWSNCYIVFVFLINGGPLKGHVSSFPSLCITSPLNYFFSRPYTIHFSFRYVGENLFDLWKDMYWYYWPVFYSQVGVGWGHFHYEKYCQIFCW